MSNNTAISSDLYLSNYQKETRNTGNSNLGKDEFLKILITQLQNQDPLKPMEDKEFIAQMATFSSLEQMTNLNKTMENFILSQTSNEMLKYSEMIGKKVEWRDIGATTGEDGKPTIETGSGVVKSIKMKDGMIVLELDNGKEVMSYAVTKIVDAEAKPVPNPEKSESENTPESKL
ncbi:flagellar hook assembly protein FlgD [Metabacillus fastidiosus]|uniref:flagellar hook assembly protein FlgD n=1 Tax=Metabacillus fastidiosus TaxID=1458 RepID=UPI002DB5DC19|nr:flagellar hook assembly protein FlgD [Metabacillus fastidiosus]MEC2076975.1 flagellar hook assembly protein FlgD [Metabacillus fastidiosus]